jgi:lysine 6-dehydrogenase
LAVEAGVHFADLGGNTEIVRQQQKLDPAARDRKISIMPDCGLAPGMVNILAAEGIRRLDAVEAVRLFVGGLPQHPRPPLNYNIVYSLEGVLDYYTSPSWVLRNGRLETVEALSDLETVEFPEPVGPLEAFHTAGGASTMPWDYEGRIPLLEYKTLRYPGHAHIVRAIRELGLLELEPVVVGGATVRPRDVFVQLVDAKLRQPEIQDLVALMVVVTGTKGGASRRVVFELLDFADTEHGISAMMRTTGYSLSITGQMQVGGRVGRYGVTTAYEGMPFEPYVKALAKRGIVIQEKG